MMRELQSCLEPIRLRRRFDRALRWGIAGLLFTALAGCLWFLAAKLGWVSNPAFAWLVPLIGLAVSSFVGFVWPTSRQTTARLVDKVCGLKDRTSTALDFAGRTQAEPIHQLQIQDALDRLSAVRVKEVVPLKSPRLVPIAIAALMAMIGLSFLGLPAPVANNGSSDQIRQIVLEQSELLEETLVQDLRDLAEETEDPEVEKLLEELQLAIEELKDPEIDQREALAELSEMQASLTSAIEQLSIEQIDSQLQQLAEALQVADATQAASQSLQESKYDKAAEQLEKIDASTMERKEKNALEAKLAEMKKNLGSGKKGQLGEAVEELIDGLKNDDASKCKGGMCKAAGVCRKHGVKKRISDCLACQLNRLSECKCACQCQGNKPCNNVAKSDSPSNNWGTGKSNQPFGDEKTKLDSKRKQEDVSGIAGEGPSERETTSSPEAKQDAARTYRERYTQFRKQMEEVLDQEPLPLGHRETVRRYFESIRPNADGE